jgi:chemotaxis family two-component system response regulator PixG
MTGETTTNTGLITKLTALKQDRFSGQLLVTGLWEQEWIFYLFLGRILYATGGTHPVRRWQRNLTVHCPKIALHQLKLSSNNSSSSAAAFNISWEYQLLYSGVEQRQITREQAAKIIGAILAEVLFDVTQAMEVTFQTKPENYSFPQLVLLDPGQVITEVQQVWQTWQKAKIVACSPNRAPAIKQPEQLQQQTSASVFQVLTKLLDGQSTLRDLSVKMKRDVVEVTCSLLPYIQAGLLELIDIPDNSAPIAPPPSVVPPEAAPQAPLVACVDDSALVCQSMEKILTTAGYQFLGIQDSLRAIATLLTRKPDLIFLDLVMPNTNGYEICTQLRQVSAFRHTPIIILTGNDSIIYRVRAKLVGSSDFLSKPVNAETVLAVARYHLNQSSLVK